MKARIIFGVLLALTAVILAESKEVAPVLDAPLVERMFPALPVLGNSAPAIQQELGKAGIQWPVGSGLRYWPEEGLIAVSNTPANIYRLQRLLECDTIPCQVEITVEYVAYDAVEIGKLAVGQAVTMEALTNLWAVGKGRLLAAPRLVTRSGTEAVIRGVRELIYPASLPDPAATNAPGDVETRELGAILSVVPEISPEGHMINMTIQTEWVELAGWELYGMEGKGKGHEGAARKPVFYRASIEPKVTLVNGVRALVGGGVPGRDEGLLIYMFATARLVDVEGKPVSTFEQALQAEIKRDLHEKHRNPETEQGSEDD